MTMRNTTTQIAIVGMGCTKFGDHWDKNADDLLIEAVTSAVDSARGLTLDDVDAFWLGTTVSGISGLVLSRPLKLKNKPVTRVENMCATGSDALRNACYAVASGACDVAMAVGVEKLKDSNMQGLVVPGAPTDGTTADMTAPAMFSLLVPAYMDKYGVSRDDIRHVMSHIASKNHGNGARNPRAHFQRAVSIDTITQAPKIAGDLNVFDCSGISDGSAAAIVCRAEDAHKYTDSPLFIRALALSAGSDTGASDPSYDYTTFPEVAACAENAYVQAGVTDPSTEISMAEVHDCFTPTELVLMEDLGFSRRGEGWKDVLAGKFDLDGQLPVNPDGGLKSFGHPIGASGLRMMFEMWLQFRGEAGDRQLKNPKLGLTHNLGGQPGGVVSFVSIVGNEPR